MTNFTLINIAFDVSHLLSGGMVVISFMLLYQTRLSSLLDIFAAHAVVLGGAVAWQAVIQHAPQLYVTALIALVVKAGAIPMALRHIVKKLNIHREIIKIININ